MFLVYKSLTSIFYPLLLLIIYFRKFVKKEDKERFKEKIFSSHFNPKKENGTFLIWIHGASIGEITSIIPLVKELKNLRKEINFLITTTTMSSGILIEKYFSADKQIIHRYFPVDTPHLSRKFINSWMPNLVCFVDSEIWPNFINEIKKNKIPLILVNGRITEKTFKRWKIIRGFAEKIFSSFDICLASNKRSMIHLQNFKAKNVKYFGNLKFITNTNSSSNLKDVNKFFLDKHKVWCAASTHNYEEEFCVNAHLEIKKVHKDVITIIIPRHINRIDKIHKKLKKFNIKIQILNDNDVINSDTEILLINSFGKLTQYFKYCKSVFIGKSILKKLISVGGQNPIEAAKFGCKIYHGPYVSNFDEVYEFLNNINVAEKIENFKEISLKITNDLNSPKIMNEDNIKKIDNYGKEILKKTVAEFSKIILR